jgi:hypothetical protein
MRRPDAGVFAIDYLTLLRWETARAGVCTRSGHLMKKTMHKPTVSHTHLASSQRYMHIRRPLYTIPCLCGWGGRGRGQGRGKPQEFQQIWVAPSQMREAP